MWTSRLRDLLARWRAKAAIDTRQNADVRRSLVESLYASPASLAVGAIAGSAVSVAVARVAHDGLVTIIAIFICIIALSRNISDYYFDLQVNRGAATWSRSWELIYELGGWSEVGLAVLLAFACLVSRAYVFFHFRSVFLFTIFSDID